MQPDLAALTHWRRCAGKSLMFWLTWPKRAQTLNYVEAPQLMPIKVYRFRRGRHSGCWVRCRKAQFLSQWSAIKLNSRCWWLPGRIGRLNDLYEDRQALIVFCLYGGGGGGPQLFMSQLKSATIGPDWSRFLPALVYVIGSWPSGRSTVIGRNEWTAKFWIMRHQKVWCLMDEVGRWYQHLLMDWRWPGAALEKLVRDIGAYRLSLYPLFRNDQLPSLYDKAANVHLDAIEHGRQDCIFASINGRMPIRVMDYRLRNWLGAKNDVHSGSQTKLAMLNHNTP